MTASELQTLNTLLHSASSVHLGVEVISNLEVISPQIVALTEQALFDWIALGDMNFVSARWLIENDIIPRPVIQKSIHAIDCIVRKPFITKQAVPHPEQCKI